MIENLAFPNGCKVELLVDFASGSAFAPIGTICTVRRYLSYGFVSIEGPDRHIWLARPSEIRVVPGNGCGG